MGGAAGAYRYQQIAGGTLLAGLRHNDNHIGNPEAAIGIATIHRRKAGGIHPEISRKALRSSILHPHNGHIKIDGVQCVLDPLAGGGQTGVFRLRQRVRLLKALQNKQHHDQQRSHNDNEFPHGRTLLSDFGLSKV